MAHLMSMMKVQVLVSQGTSCRRLTMVRPHRQHNTGLKHTKVPHILLRLLLRLLLRRQDYNHLLTMDMMRKAQHTKAPHQVQRARLHLLARHTAIPHHKLPVHLRDPNQVLNNLRRHRNQELSTGRLPINHLVHPTFLRKVANMVLQQVLTSNRISKLNT